VVGENLGTVPDYANAALQRHRILGLNVGQFGVNISPAPALANIPSGNVASLNTHDTATFAGFWSGSDIRDRRELGLIDDAQVAQENAQRAAQRAALIDFLRQQKLLAEDSDDPAAVMQAWLCFVAAHGADLLLINLEDLWLEALPQNVPGTWQERPNWRRKARLSLDALRDLGTAMSILSAVNQTRMQAER
jgi:4-alpha-glucanotransferase